MYLLLLHIPLMFAFAALSIDTICECLIAFPSSTGHLRIFLFVFRLSIPTLQACFISFVWKILSIKTKFTRFNMQSVYL